MVNALVKMHRTHSVLVETLVMVNPPTPAIETHLAMTMGKCHRQNALSPSYSHYNFTCGKHSFWNAHGPIKTFSIYFQNTNQNRLCLWDHKKKLFHSLISCSILATNWFTTPIAQATSRKLYIPL